MINILGLIIQVWQLFSLSMNYKDCISLEAHLIGLPQLLGSNYR
jgi:hypothetical protein